MVPEVPVVEQLLLHLVTETGPVRLDAVLRKLLSGRMASARQLRRGSFQRDGNAVGCFSCGKAGDGATRCPDLDETFSCLLPGWQAEKTPGGYVMISRVVAERHRVENGD